MSNSKPYNLQQAGQDESHPHREKTWDDRAIEEKCEVLRREVRQLRQSLSFAHRQLHEAVETCRRHTHGMNGDVLVPVGFAGGGLGLVGVESAIDPLA